MTTQSGNTILIVDDSEELLEVLSIIIGKQGYEVITKNSPEGIMNFVQQNKIDLLLLDVIFPDHNGKEICKQLKSGPLTSYFPVLLMSVTPDFLIEFKECGADGIIEKPFDLSTLIEKINGCLHIEPVN